MTKALLHILLTFSFLLVLSVAASATDLSAALSGKRMHVVRADGTDLGTVAFEEGGVAHRTAPDGKRSDGSWAIRGDRICVTMPPRAAACYHSAATLVASGHATMTNGAGKQVNVSVE